MDTAEIRRRFLAHFEAAGHAVVPSASLLADDPNLLFVHAGMVPFKPYFLGQETPPWDRATSVQKCVRTPDIEDVGKTTRHGTFFEMCGNFSFGDYFKERAIELAWSLITNPVDDGGFGLDKDRLYPSVLVGDEEAIGLWMKVTGLPSERIVQLGNKENYWSMGVPGPGGPCSEILYDRGPDFGPDFDATDARPRHAVRARGPAPGDLEPGLHAGRAQRRPLQVGLRHRGLAAQEEHRHRHGPGPRRPAAAGQEEHVRDRRHVRRDRQGRGADRQDVRRRRGRRRPVPRRRRPRPLLDDADRRRRHAGQRRSRLRAAPAAAPRGALDAAAGLRGPGAARADAGLARRDGPDLRQPRHRLAAHLPGRLRRGGRLPQDAPVRHPDLRPGRRRGEAAPAGRPCPASAPSRSTTPTASRST